MDKILNDSFVDTADAVLSSHPGVVGQRYEIKSSEEFFDMKGKNGSTERTKGMLYNFTVNDLPLSSFGVFIADDSRIFSQSYVGRPAQVELTQLKTLWGATVVLAEELDASTGAYLSKSVHDELRKQLSKEESTMVTNARVAASVARYSLRGGNTLPLKGVTKKEGVSGVFSDRAEAISKETSGKSRAELTAILDKKVMEYNMKLHGVIPVEKEIMLIKSNEVAERAREKERFRHHYRDTLIK